MSRVREAGFDALNYFRRREGTIRKNLDSAYKFLLPVRKISVHFWTPAVFLPEEMFETGTYTN